MKLACITAVGRQRRRFNTWGHRNKIRKEDDEGKNQEQGLGLQLRVIVIDKLLPYGLGLGEPKFNVDGTRFNGAWGRPQGDGPALRAIALIEYSNWLLDQGEDDKVANVLWPIIFNDIFYVGNSSGYDLWEVYGFNFFITQIQYKNLVAADQLTGKIEATYTSYVDAPNVIYF